MELLTPQRGGRGMANREPKRAGATLKNFFVENSENDLKPNFYIFLTTSDVSDVVVTHILE